MKIILILDSLYIEGNGWKIYGIIKVLKGMVSGEHLQEVVPEEDSVVQVEEDLVDQEEEEDLTGLIEVISEEETEEEQDFQ